MNIRKKTRRRWAVWPAVLAVVALVAVICLGMGCGGSAETTTTVSPTTTAGGATVQVTMKNLAFVPDTVTIKVGDTVTWTNEDSATHDVKADDGSFASPRFAKGGTFSFTFTTPGTYPYSCTVHPSMKGTVIVQ